jgi:enamine deaminase RidA (YjgF/YER057c/UK114 family)
MSPRQRASSGSPLEPTIGFSRAVREGAIVAISGTAPIGPDGSTVGGRDPAAQARRCFEIIRDALGQVGSDLAHVTRTRIFLTRIEDWQAVAAVHGEFFGEVRPACTVVQVTRFIDPAWLVEVEIDAVVPSNAGSARP